MQTTRGELLAHFLRFVTENDDDEARNIAEDLMNRAVSAIWLKHDWQAFESPEPYQIRTAIGQARYSLPAHFGRVGPGRLRNLTRGTWLRGPGDTGRLEEDDPAFGTSLDTLRGTPTRWWLGGIAGVHTQPIGSGWALEVLSTDATDVDVVVSLEGEDPPGIEQRLQLRLTGTTPVAANEWRFVDAFGKSFVPSTVAGTAAGTTEHTTSRGEVILRRVAEAGPPVVAATRLQTLASIEAAKGHQTLRLYPTPDVAEIIAIPIYRRPTSLIYDGDALPSFWREAVFEEMQVQWRVNTGELSLDQATSMIRPALLDLIDHDNRHRPRPRRRPFGGF